MYWLPASVLVYMCVCVCVYVRGKTVYRDTVLVSHNLAVCACMRIYVYTLKQTYTATHTRAQNKCL